MALNATSVSNLPAEFTDKLSAELLLQPDAEFIFARWAYSALVQAQMGNMDGFDMAAMQMKEGRLPSGSGSAANMAEAMSSGMGGPLLVSMGMAYPDLIKMVKMAREPGEVIKINRPKFIDGATTEANRLLAGANAKVFGTNSQPLLMEQVDVTIKEYAGPGDASGNIVPISVGRFTQDRAAHDLIVQTGYELRRDRYKFVDDICMSRYIAAANAGSYVTVAGGLAGASSLSGDGNEPFTFTEIVKAVEQLKARKIPGLGGAGRYVAVLDLHQVSDLKQDPQYQRLSVFEPQYNPLFPGYMRTCENVMICESNRMPRLTSGIGANSVAYQGLILAPGSLGWASAMDAMAIRDRNDDGGRFAAFAWHAYEGFQMLDDRFAQLVISG